MKLTSSGNIPLQHPAHHLYTCVYVSTLIWMKVTERWLFTQNIVLQHLAGKQTQTLLDFVLTVWVKQTEVEGKNTLSENDSFHIFCQLFICFVNSTRLSEIVCFWETSFSDNTTHFRCFGIHEEVGKTEIWMFLFKRN